MTEIKIAGFKKTNDWKELEKKLKPNYDEHWVEAYSFFEMRIQTRFTEPIKAIIEMNKNLGEGFAVVNLQCSLIETIESFICGWIYKYPNFINSKGEKFKSNNEIFKSFFNNRVPFKNYYPKINGKQFYSDVRCGLLHETQTKNNWKIKKGIEDGTTFEEKDRFKIIYRENFQIDLETLIENYKNSIINGVVFDGIPACELRENFILKFNHICNAS